MIQSEPKEKIAAAAKRGKTGNWYQARENMHPLPSQENVQLVQSAGTHATGARRMKHATDTKRGEMRVIQVSTRLDFKNFF